MRLNSSAIENYATIVNDDNDLFFELKPKVNGTLSMKIIAKQIGFSANFKITGGNNI